MQRSKTFHTFHLVHFGAISQLHALQKFHDGGQIQKFLPPRPTCWKALCYMCLCGGGAMGNKNSSHVTSEKKIQE
jgi:hypothetical protein